MTNSKLGALRNRRDQLARFVEDVETGRLRFEEGFGDQEMRDATAQRLSDLKSQIAQLDAQIDRLERSRKGGA